MKVNSVTHEIRKRGASYVVYRMEHSETGGSGSPVYWTTDYEDARKNRYELNGWKYKTKTHEQQTDRTPE